MEAIQLNKLACARRQLQTAVNLFFHDGDAVSIHTLTCAAYNVIRDVNDSRNGRPMHAKQIYVQMSGRPSVSELNQPENFFKHADRDSNAELTFYPKFTECLLVDACEKYRDITGDHVLSFIAFTLWFMCQSPEKFDIPEAWEDFANDARDLHWNNNRHGFYDRFMAHLSELDRQGRDIEG